jgi:hypothetical protein
VELYGELSELVCQAALANSRFATQEADLPPALSRCIKATLQERELVLAAYKFPCLTLHAWMTRARGCY